MKTVKWILFTSGIFLFIFSFVFLFETHSHINVTAIDAPDIERQVQIQIHQNEWLGHRVNALLIASVLLIGFFKDWNKEETKN
jgi:hypothetical protein